MNKNLKHVDRHLKKIVRNCIAEDIADSEDRFKIFEKFETPKKTKQSKTNF